MKKQNRKERKRRLEKDRKIKNLNTKIITEYKTKQDDSQPDRKGLTIR